MIRLEPRRRVGHRLLERTREHLFEVLLIFRPPHLHELMDGNSSARLAETLQAGHQSLSVQLCALADHESRLEQAQRVNELRCVQRKLEGDRATKGVPDNVRARNAEIRQQPPTVAGLLRESRRPLGAAAAVAATVWLMSR